MVYQIWETKRQEFTPAGDICVSLKTLDTQAYMDIRRVFRNDRREIFFMRQGVCLKMDVAKDLFAQMKSLPEAADGTLLQSGTTSVLKRSDFIYFSKFEKKLRLSVSELIEVSTLVATLL